MDVECPGTIDLKDIDSKYKLLFDCALDMVFLVNINGNIVDVNQAAVKVYGYSREVLLSMNVRDLRAPAERGTAEEQLREAFAKGAIYETVHMRKDGREFPVEISSRGIVLGSTKMLVAIVRDITKRKEAERNLSRIAAIVESSDDAILAMTLEGIITEWNLGAGEIYGYSADEAIGRSVSLLIPPSLREELDHILETIRKGGRIKHFETVRVRKDGSKVDVSLTASPIKDPAGQINGISWTARDISERKRLEKQQQNTLTALSLLTRRREAILRSMDEGLVETDVHGNIIYINRYALDKLGFRSPEEAKMGIEQFINLFEMYHPDGQRVERRERPLIRASFGEEFRDIDVLVRRTDTGREFWGSFNGTPVFAGERLLSMIVTFRDITGRKKLEDNLAKAKDQAELYLDLMGHDINNMNQIAMGYLETALDTFKLGEEEREFLERPLDSLKSSATLIGNVRKLQKLGEGGLKHQKIDLCAVLSKLVADHSHPAGRTVTINFTPIPGCNVFANELISDVFSNLIGNSIKHSDPQKPLTINIWLEPITEKGKEYFKVIVEDNGPGIPDELKNKLFMRFQRGQTKATGKGLGLYLVRTLVSDYHGKIWVEDRIKGDHTKGARFVVMLPAVEK